MADDSASQPHPKGRSRADEPMPQFIQLHRDPRDVVASYLVEGPERELRRLCAFLGEDYHPAMLQFGDRKDAGYLDVEESWKGMTRQELTRARVGRFRTRLTPRQIWKVGQRLSAILPQLGYETGSPAAAPVYWHGALWAERIYLKALHTLGVRRGLLDEQAVQSRRKPPDAAEASR